MVGLSTTVTISQGGTYRLPMKGQRSEPEQRLVSGQMSMVTSEQREKERKQVLVE